MMKTFVLSTVGTSILTNILSKEESDDNWRKKLRDSANLKEEDLLKDVKLKGVKEKIIELSNRAKEKLSADNVDNNRRSSAELNGIYGFYDNQLSLGKNDVHWLIATDTFQGRVCANIVRDYLSKNIENTQLYLPKNLSTKSTDDFSSAIKEIVKWCDETIPDFQNQQYKVCFNLVGGFKSLQGYLNTIGMFYADKIIYIFENSEELITIPRLPIKIDVDQLKPYTVQLAMMAQSYLCLIDELENLPEMLVESDEQNGMLSSWGQLVWNKSKENLLSEGLLPFPGLTYEKSFQNDFTKLSKQEHIKIQETLAKVATLLKEGQGVASLKKDGGLKYENYKNKNVKGQPIGHFRVNQEARISCVIDSTTLKLRHYGRHDNVNNNP